MKRIAAITLAAGLAVGWAAGEERALAEPKGKDFAYKIDELPVAYRLVAPRWLYEPEAEFTVWAPPDEAKAAHRLVVRCGDETVADEKLSFQPPGGNEKPRVSKAVVYLDASGWPDGTCTAELRRVTDEKPEGEVARSAPFEVVRTKVDEAFKGETKDELLVWLEHANRPRDIWKKVPMWPTLERAMAEPKQLYKGLRGLVLRSYFSDQLQRRMPYAVYVPEAYTGRKAMPLMILLHGSGGNYLNIVSDMYEGQEMEASPMLVANAGAFLHQEYKHMALIDVLRVLEDMQAKYKVDPDRVYVQGISLGGRGSMELAALRPDLFAAISPQGTYGMMAEPDDIPFYLWQDPWSQWSVARWDFRSYLPNLRHVPMQIIYGYHDTTTPPLNALTYRHLTNKRYGGKAEALGFDADHNISWPVYKWSDTREWLLEHKRVTDPAVVTARTSSLRFNRFYWVTIDAMDVQWQMASVEARLEGDRLAVEARNIARMTLEPPSSYKEVEVNGEPVALGPGPRPKALVLAKGEGDAWERVKSDAPAWPPEGRLVKRHGLSGPIWDVLHGRCLVVYGTGGSEEETRRLEAIARGVAELDVAWGERSWPVLADTAVSDEAKEACNLMLIGDARTNRLLAGQAWPFDLDRIGRGEGIEAFGEVYGEPGDVLMFIYPSPYAAGRYVYVVAPARPAEAQPRALNPAGTWDIGIWSDWLVRRYGGGGGEGRRSGRLGRGSLLDGVFDAEWRLQEMPGTMLQPHPMNWE